MNRTLRSLTSLALLICACEGAADEGGVASTPVEYSNYLVYIADGTYDPSDPSWDPPTLEELARDSWGWSDAEIAQFELDAKAFFLERFEIDVDDPANEGRFHFTPVVLEPRARYRVTTMGGRDVPPEGWLLSDGSWQVIFDDPDGYEIGGDVAGYVVPPGGFLVYGYYQIVTHDSDPLMIGFKSYSPLVTDDVGLGVFRCEIWTEEFGDGVARGVSHGVFRQHQDLDGNVTFDIRNVLTFD